MPERLTPYGIVLGCCLAYWLIFQFIYEKKYRPLPFQAALPSFFLAGFGSWLLATVCNTLLLQLAGIAHMSPGASLWTLGAGSLLIGGDEELLKYLLVLFIARMSGKFKHPPLALVFAAAAALGFATVENLSYAAEAGDTGVALRAVSATPVHLGTAAVWSLGLAKGKFLDQESYCKAGAFYLLPATVLHAAYNFGCFALAVRTPMLAVTFAVVYGLFMLIVAYCCFLQLLNMHEIRLERVRNDRCPKCGRIPETRHSHCTHCGAPLGIGFGLVIQPGAPRNDHDNASKTRQE